MMFIEKLRKKNSQLQSVGNELKNYFIGLDDTINQIVSSVRVWYLMPELMMRPIVINLWGLTGTGKTSLVRKFVQLIQMTDSFVEIQMDSSRSSSQKIKDYIDRSGVQQVTQSVLLLDEMQRYRTLDEEGLEVKDIKCFQDVWMLLSDGKFQSASEKKSEIVEMIMDDRYDLDNQSKNTNICEKTTYNMRYWKALSLKKLLNSNEEIEEIMKWPNIKKTEALQTALRNDQTFEGETYSKMLIFVCGNIDEAYRMSGDTTDADTCADVFHEFSKKINILDIKQALSKRFKPEQVSRFGNNHIIYPSISKKSYQEIIKKNISTFCDNIEKKHDIKIVAYDSVYHTIYDNSVFPAQGVRPVLSTLAYMFENHMPLFMLKALEENTKIVKIKYSDSSIIGEINDKHINIPIQLTIDKIKKNKNQSERVLTSVHEAGHALVYSLIFKVVPTQIRSVTSNNETDGFIGVHLVNLSKIWDFGFGIY